MIDELWLGDRFPVASGPRQRGVTGKLGHEIGRHLDEEEMARGMNMKLDEYLSVLKSCDSRENFAARRLYIGEDKTIWEDKKAG